MLYIMGIGLRGVPSLTLEEADAIRRSSMVFFETYTSVSPEGTISELETTFSRQILPLGRKEIEESGMLIELSIAEDVSLIVTGDPLSATTHNQLRADAMEAGVKVSVMENASILSVIPGRIGLFPYRMGPPVSLPFPYDIFLPRSVCDKIMANIRSNLHTIVLLDLKDGRTMFTSEALGTLLKMEEKYEVGSITPKTKVFAVSRVSQKGEKLIYDTVENIISLGLEESPAALVIPAEMNHNEEFFTEKFNKKCSYYR